jgi:hypothetical protein
MWGGVVVSPDSVVGDIPTQFCSQFHSHIELSPLHCGLETAMAVLMSSYTSPVSCDQAGDNLVAHVQHDVGVGY